MIYILLGAVIFYGNPAPVHAEFNSQGACEMAKAAMEDKFAAKVFCVPKG